MKQKFMHCFLCALLTLTCLTVCAKNENDETSWFGKVENFAKSIFSENFIKSVKGVCNHEKVQYITEWMKKHPGTTLLGCSFLSAGFLRKFRLPLSSFPFYASLVGIAAGAGIFLVNKECPQCIAQLFKPNTTQK